MRNVTAGQVDQAFRNGKLNELFPKITLTIEENYMMQVTNFSDLPIRQHLIERLEMSPGNLVILCAAGGSGKTMFAQYMATCVSSGKPLFGVYPVSKGGVIHIDMEQSKVQTQRRYIRLANGLEVSSLDVSRVTLKARLDDPQLPMVEIEKEMVELCTGKSLCIVDSLKAISCTDENSSDIEKVLKMLKRVGEKTQCTIMVIHHKGKGGRDNRQTGRGSSAIYDSCDVQIDLDSNNDVYELSCAKNREGPYFFGIKYRILDTGEHHVQQKCTVKLEFQLLQDDIKSTKQTQQEKIVTALMQQEELKFNDLFEQVKGDRVKFHAVLTAMVEAHELNEVAGPRNSKLYSLTHDFKTMQEWK